MSIIHLAAVGGEDPIAAELAAIECEWPLIAAELDVLDAEIALINSAPNASELDRRRVRRAEHRVLTVKRKLAYLDGAPALPCGCAESVVTSFLRGGGEQCSSCGSTWDRHDRIIAFRGITSADGAA
ncbi:DUF6284 family protein [Kribbella kalugense]|uniref:Uncharacterized protein n=1 Tax=Kribbella kalugense TaxID=2512221 RepID=A0A4R7ZMD6_9ACTN|nr:DUF6284 family protein [Kribbella kalugense]TDW18585.1 hypothetical protein EV650_5174 [Kribbella kalugense]